MGRQVVAPPATPGRRQCAPRPVHREMEKSSKLHAPGPRFPTTEPLTSLWKRAWVGTAVASLPSKPDAMRGSHDGEVPVPHAGCLGGVMMGARMHPAPGRVPLGGVRTGHGATRGAAAVLGFSHREGRAESPQTEVLVNTRPQASQTLHFLFTANKGETQI